MKSRVSLFAISLLLASAGFAQQRLQLNLQEGQTYRQITKSDANIIQQIMGQEMEISITLEGEMLFTVQKANSSHYDMAVSYDRLSMTMGSAQGEAVFDSDNPTAEDAMSQVLGSMVGKNFNLKMTKTGKILEITNVEEMWAVALDQQGLTGAERQQVMSQLSQTYGAAAIKGNIEMVTAVFPDNPVSVGDTWSTSTELSSGMQGIATTSYTYEGTEGGYHILSGEGTIKSSNKEEYIKSGGIDLKFDMSGSMTSKVKVNANSGWISKADVSQTITGVAQMKGNDQLPDGLSIPMEIENKMAVTDQ